MFEQIPSTLNSAAASAASASELIPPTLISAAAGALIGAVSAAYLRYKSERKAARQDLVGSVGTFTPECVAAITEIYGASLTCGNEAEKWKARAKFKSLYGRGMGLEVRIFREFRDRRVRASFHRILTRLNRLAEYVSQNEPLSAKQFELGMRWIDEATAQTTLFAAKRAGIELVDRKRYVFIGFRRLTAEDTRVLSFDDAPPPWVFHVTLDFARKPLSANESNHVVENIARKVGEMRCATHGGAPHITLHGVTPKGRFTVEMQSCCEAFSVLIQEKMP